MWVDHDLPCKIGDTFFLVQLSPQGRADVWRLQDAPARTNNSHESTLVGSCGETNNTHKQACGVWRVAAFNTKGTRVQLRELEGDALRAWLDAEGWGELLARSHG